MTIYILILIITYLISSRLSLAYSYNGIKLPQLSRNRRIISCIFVMWVALAACRGITGSDASTYYYQYKQLCHMPELGMALDSSRDKLYSLIMWFVSNATNGSWIIATIVIAILAYGPILHTICKASNDAQLSILMYWFLMSFFYSYNGTRQAISTSFAAMAYYEGLREKKYSKYILLMLIAIGFHIGALFVIPLHLVSLLNFNSLTATTILILFFLGSFVVIAYWDVVISVFDFLGQEKLVNSYSNLASEKDMGSGLLRTVVYFCPLILGILIFPKLRIIHKDATHDMIMVAIQAIIMVYSIRNANLSQIGEYFTIGNVILMPKLIDSFNSNNKRIAKYTVIVLFFIYMIMMLNHGEYGVAPYVPVWRSNTF